MTMKMSEIRPFVGPEFERYVNPWFLILQNLLRITVGQIDENGNSTLVQNGMDWNVTLWYDKEA